jgi:hypothetical protein
MAIAPEEGMTAAENKAANAAVNKARVTNSAPATPAVNTTDALRKLTGGQTLTAAERAALGLAPAPVPTQTGGSTPGGAGTGTTTFTPAGTSAGFELIGDGKMRREKIADGKGGFYYGTPVANPDYKDPNAGADSATNVAVMKAALKGRGYNSSIIESSTAFLTKLVNDLDGDVDNAVEIYLNNKEYTLKDGTKVTSPFYDAYGYLNESATSPKSATELYNFVEGAKSVVTKYNLNALYMSKESLQEYTKNNVTVDDLDARANLARLRSIEADPAYIEAAKKAGYITDATQLTDFFLNPKIGKEALTQNAAVVGIAAEAVRRAGSGITFNKANTEKLAAGLIAQGYGPEGAQQLAATAYQTVSETLNPTVKLAGIYDKSAETSANKATIQSELEQESFMKMESERRKRLKAQEEAAFQGQSGVSQYGLNSGGGLGQSF